MLDPSIELPLSDCPLPISVLCYLPLALAAELVCGAFVGATYTSRYKVHVKILVLVKGAHNIYALLRECGKSIAAIRCL